MFVVGRRFPPGGAESKFLQRFGIILDGLPTDRCRLATPYSFQFDLNELSAARQLRNGNDLLPMMLVYHAAERYPHTDLHVYTFSRSLLLERGTLFRRLFVLRHHCCSSAATSRWHCFSHRTLHHSVWLYDRL